MTFIYIAMSKQIMYAHQWGGPVIFLISEAIKICNYENHEILCESFVIELERLFIIFGGNITHHSAINLFMYIIVALRSRKNIACMIIHFIIIPL